MNRTEFEEMIAAVLLDMPKNHKSKGKGCGIGGPRYGKAEIKVGKVASILATSNRDSYQPIPLPSPALVPPCF